MRDFCMTLMKPQQQISGFVNFDRLLPFIRTNERTPLETGQSITTKINI